MVVALDPGRHLGVAYVSAGGELLRAFVTDPSRVAELEFPEGATVVVGDGTGSAALVAALAELGLAPVVVDEVGTSLEARRLYYAAHPPRGLMRLVPRGMLSPPRPIDDFAAYAIALRWLAAHGGRPS